MDEAPTMRSDGIVPLDGRPHHVFVRVDSEATSDVTGLVESAEWPEPGHRPADSAARGYVELSNDVDASAAGVISELVAACETAGRTDLDTRWTVEVSEAQLRGASPAALDESGIDRLVVRADAPVGREWLESDVSVSIELSIDELSDRFESILDRCLAVGHRHISIEVASATDPAYEGALEELLESAAECLTTGGLRRLSRVTFGAPHRESPFMRHIRCGGEYLGVGSGAASMQIVGDQVIRHRRTSARGETPEMVERLSARDHLRELVMLQVPSDAGIRLHQLSARLPGVPEASIKRLGRALHRRVAHGQLRELSPWQFVPTHRGWRQIDSIVTELWEASAHLATSEPVW